MSDATKCKDRRSGIPIYGCAYFGTTHMTSTQYSSIPFTGLFQ